MSGNVNSVFEHCDVVVVGAGLSGLSAARILLGDADPGGAQHVDLSIAVLDANGRVGGRMLVDADGTDLGGTYIGPTQDRLMRIVDLLGLRLKAVDVDGLTALCTNGRVSKFHGMIPTLGPLALMDLNAALVRLHEMCFTIDPVSPHLSPRAAELDALSVEEWLVRTCWTRDAKAMMRTAVRSILCTEPAQLSLLGLLHYLRHSGGPKRIFETRNGAQDSKVLGGTGQIPVLLAERLEKRYESSSKAAAGSRLIWTNHAVRELRHDCDGEWPCEVRGVLTAGAQGECDATATPFTIRCRYIILALPPVQMQRLMYAPPLTPQRAQALQRYPFGHLIKTFMYYATPFWKTSGFCGIAVNDGGIVQAAFDDSATLIPGAGGCLMGFVLTDVNGQLRQSAEQRKQAIACEYAKLFGTELALSPVGFKEKCWADEPWVGGCYTGVPGPKVMTECAMAHAQHFSDRVFVAGTEAARIMMGYMDGAVEAGERCGRNVLVREGVLPPSAFDTISEPEPSPQMPFVPAELTPTERFTPSVPQFLVGIAVAVGVAAAAASMLVARLRFDGA